MTEEGIESLTDTEMDIGLEMAIVVGEDQAVIIKGVPMMVVEAKMICSITTSDLIQTSSHRSEFVALSLAVFSFLM